MNQTLLGFLKRDKIKKLRIYKKVKTKDLDKSVKDYIIIKKKGIPKSDSSYLELKFSASSRIGDTIEVKKAIDQKYSELDKKFERLRQSIELYDRYTDKGINLDKLPIINELQLLEWQQYTAEKALYTSKLIQAVNLVSFNGEDISSLPLDKRIQYIDDPRFDVKIAQKMDKQFAKLDFGLDSDIEVKNPITGEVSQRHFTFRLVDILSSIQLSDDNEYDIFYDD
jgi:hypothetical protein